MRVVIHLERAGFQRFTHACRDKLVGFFLHIATFLCKTDYLLALVLFTLLASDNAKLLHALE